MTRHTEEDFQAMRAWNRRLGSPANWHVDKAVREGAPLDALYKDDEANRWVTVRDLHESHDFRVWFEEDVLKLPKHPRRFLRTLTVRVDFPAGTEVPSIDEAALVKAMNLPEGATTSLVWMQ